LKNNLFKTVFGTCLLLLSYNTYCQNLDSLKLALKNAKHDTTRCNLLNLLSENASEEEWPVYNEQLLKLADKSAVNASPAIRPIYLKHLGVALNNAGYLATNQGDIPKALEYLHRSLKIQEEVNDKKGVASSLINIGFIYDGQGDNAKAIEYYQKSLIILEEIKDKEGMANCLNNMGHIHKKQGNIEKALEYFQRSLKVRQEISDKMGIANSLNNIGLTYYNKKDNEKALEYFHQSLKIAESLNDKRGIAFSTNFIATTLQNMGNSKEAQKFGIRSLNTAKELGFPDNIRRAAMSLKAIYESQGDYKNTLKMYELQIQMRDSVYNIESRKTSIKKQMQYQYEKKAAADSVKVAEEKKVVSAQLKQEKTTRFALYGGLILVLTFSAFMFNRFKVTQKQKQIIEIKEQETRQQKHLVEEKNKEITDSITYAKRLQDAILPPQEFIDKYVPNNFVLYKPKDIVAGDFYWAEKFEDLFFIAAADSTGHGVPGAMVSVVCSNALNRTVKEFILRDTGKILDKTRELVIETFEKSSSEVKDGMDISLLCIDTKNKKVLWSGANNPLWYIEASSKPQLNEIKSDKQPIGKSDHSKSFTTHQIDYKEGTIFYLFTDGFSDQFGGPNGKKFKQKQFSDLLISVYHEPLNRQSEIIHNAFNNWKRDLEQVDDVCVIGVKL
jgi:serine phosphatase RsbU (regulator of sigma subunit)/Tfp pilus assembly protein PilF